jgi:hypothetical protein
VKSELLLVGSVKSEVLNRIMNDDSIPAGPPVMFLRCDRMGYVDRAVDPVLKCRTVDSHTDASQACACLEDVFARHAAKIAVAVVLTAFHGRVLFRTIDRFSVVAVLFYRPIAYALEIARVMSD